MSYTTLAIIWFGLWGLLWAVYFMLDGFDLGVGILYPFIAKDEKERNLLLNSIGPFWDGNEVWLIAAGGVTFAAFPTTYALMFSYLYTPLMLILFGLITRGASIEFMNKESHSMWRNGWKWAFFAGSFTVSFLLGVAFSNIFYGLPMDADGYHGTLFTLLNPYGILGGLLFVFLFMLTGAIWISLKTEDSLSSKALSYASRIWYVVLLIAGAYLIYSYFHTKLYDNYLSTPIWLVIPIIAVASLALVKLYIAKKDALKAFFFVSLSILTTIFFGIIGLYPNMIPSSINEEFSLTLYNSSSSQYTLQIMFYVIIIFIPIVIGYQIFMYKLFSSKVNESDTHY